MQGRSLLEPLDPLSPVTNPKRNILVRSSADFANSAFLSANARKKFENGFGATFSGSFGGTIPEDNSSSSCWDDNIEPNSPQRRRESRPGPPPRSNSVLGLRSNDREVDGNLKGSTDSKLALDYVDLECLLQDKMKEMGVQMPKFKNGRKQSGGMERATTPDLQRSGSQIEMENRKMAAAEAEEYAKRVREAAFLFRLCQQEIKLQIQLHCPERARLTEKTLEFYSGVLDCLVRPLDQAREELAELRTKRGEDQAFQATTTAEIRMFVKQNAKGLQSQGWQRAGNTTAPAELQQAANNPETTFSESIEHLTAVTGAALSCVPLLHQDYVSLQESSVPKADLEAAQSEILSLRNRVTELEGALKANTAEHETVLAKITSEKDEISKKYEETKKAKDEAERLMKGLEKDLVELKDQLRVSNETASQLNESLAKRDDEIKNLKETLEVKTKDLESAQAKLSEMTKDGIQLTPRPRWSDRCSEKAAGETTKEKVDAACAAWAAEEDKNNQLCEVLSATRTQFSEVQAEYAQECEKRTALDSELMVVRMELQQLKNPPRANASCGCPEPRPGFELIPLHEYLEQYLSKRFGLQGHMSSWEVEKMGKDIGWVMEAQVGLRSTDY